MPMLGLVVVDYLLGIPGLRFLVSLPLFSIPYFGFLTLDAWFRIPGLALRAFTHVVQRPFTFIEFPKRVI